VAIGQIEARLAEIRREYVPWQNAQSARSGVDAI
jgi:hypothetical protein